MKLFNGSFPNGWKVRGTAQRVCLEKDVLSTGLSRDSKSR